MLVNLLVPTKINFSMGVRHICAFEVNLTKLHYDSYWPKASAYITIILLILVAT